MDMTVPQQIKIARRVSTPLIAVATPDQHGMTGEIARSFNGNAPPVLSWDCASGVSALNSQGQEMLLERQIDAPMLRNGADGTTDDDAGAECSGLADRAISEAGDK